jgi:hypothetical protein
MFSLRKLESSGLFAKSYGVLPYISEILPPYHKQLTFGHAFSQNLKTLKTNIILTI